MVAVMGAEVAIIERGIKSALETNANGVVLTLSLSSSAQADDPVINELRCLLDAPPSRSMTNQELSPLV
jgi:hypothetical protein